MTIMSQSVVLFRETFIVIISTSAHAFNVKLGVSGGVGFTVTRTFLGLCCPPGMGFVEQLEIPAIIVDPSMSERPELPVWKRGCCIKRPLPACSDHAHAGYICGTEIEWFTIMFTYIKK